MSENSTNQVHELPEKTENRRGFINSFATVLAGLGIWGGLEKLFGKSTSAGVAKPSPNSLAGPDSYTGTICMFAGTFAPRGYMFCQGQQLQISQYSALFALLGTQFGGNGTTNFNLPDLRGRVPLGTGTGIGLTTRIQAQAGGYENITLTAQQLPSHSHAVFCDTESGGRDLKNSPSGNLPANSSSGIYGAKPGSQMNSGMISSVGGGDGHQNMQPWLCLNYIICVEGMFPPRP